MIPAVILRKCHRQLLRRLCLTYKRDLEKMSRKALLYLIPIEYKKGPVSFAWEKHLGYFVVVTRDGCIRKTGLRESSYYTKTLWNEDTLVLETQEQWKCLCEMSRVLLGEDLHQRALAFLHSPAIRDEIWLRACHPAVVERQIVRLGGIEAYYAADDTEETPVRMLPLFHDLEYTPWV